MTAPSATARVAPTGSALENGFVSKVTFAADTDVDIWEIEVKPGKIELGDKIEQSTMFNTNRGTFAAPALYDTEDGQMLVAYDPANLTQIQALLGTHTTITITYSNNDTIADFGWLRSFDPQNMVINGRPTALVAFSYAGMDSSGNEEVAVQADAV